VALCGEAASGAVKKSAKQKAIFFIAVFVYIPSSSADGP
jgi:hypothetical protein